MTQPLALVLYEKLLPGSQLVNKLQDLRYRVHNISDPRELITSAEQLKPIVVLADLQSHVTRVTDLVAALRKNQATSHLPVIAFSAEINPELQAAAEASGVTLLVSDSAILTHLPQFLDQALEVI